MRASIFAVPGITKTDYQRIIGNFASRLNDYLDSKDFKQFRSKAIAWVSKQAQLTIILREMLLSQPDAYDAPLLMTELPNYEGEIQANAIHVWAIAMMERKKRAIAEVPIWFDKYRKLVYANIWVELKKCPDLGVGGYDPVKIGTDGQSSQLRHAVVEELSSDVWLWVYERALSLYESETPIYKRIRGKARRAALLWKLNRLKERDTFISQTTLDERRGKLLHLMDAEDRSNLSVAEVRLLGRSESIDMADARSFDSILTDPETGILVPTLMISEDDIPGNEEVAEEMQMAA